MKNLTRKTYLLGSAVILLGVSLTASCAVDSADLTFDDDKFAEASGSGGKGSSSTGGGTSMGGETGSGGDASGGSASGGGTGTGGQSMSGCEASTLKCEGKQVQICTGEEWIAVGGACEFACSQGQCTGVCDPDATECLSDREHNKCDALGEWESSFCPNACVGDACGGVCVPGMSQCGGTDNLTVQRCSTEGQWVDQITCGGSCEEGSCTGSCTNGDTQCDSPTAVITCTGGNWPAPGSGVACPAMDPVCRGNACTGECVPGTQECVGSGANQGRRTCNQDGEWGATVACTNGCGGQGAGICNVCQPSATRCTGKSVEQCTISGSGWNEKADCDKYGQICSNIDGDALCTDCTPPPKGQTAPPFCQFTDVVACTEKGEWNVITDCSRTIKKLCFQGACISETATCPLLNISGCISEEKGWTCGFKVASTPSVTDCDCRSGVSCATVNP